MRTGSDRLTISVTSMADIDGEKAQVAQSRSVAWLPMLNMLVSPVLLVAKRQRYTVHVYRSTCLHQGGAMCGTIFRSATLR